MNQYDVKCPVCGTMNRGLFLDETDGLMECEHCHNVTMNIEYVRQHTVRVPFLKMAQMIQRPVVKAV